MGRSSRWCMVLVLSVTAPLLAAPAPRPSAFYGAVTVGGAPVAPGTPVSAWLGGEPFAETGTFEVDGASVFRLDVPGDVADTAAVEGGVEGQEVVFRIGNAVAAETALWSDGTVTRVDLTAAAGPDLGVAKDDGQAIARPGDLLTYTLTVTNAGPGPAAGIVLEDPVPAGTSFVAASDGGAAAGGVVVWPAFELADGASASRTLTVEVASSFPAGTTAIVNTASALDDGANGADPDLANNSATDSDALEGGPDVVVTKSSDLAAATPGADVVYTLTLENRGFQPATRVVLTDTLPAEETFLSASDDGRAVDGVVTWPAVDLAVGEVLTRTVRARIDATLPPALDELVNRAEAPVAGDVEPSDNAFAHTLPVARQTDVAVLSVDASGTVTDPQSLAIGGNVSVELTNRGTEDAAGFDVAIFEDLDGDGALTSGADNLLGTAEVALLAPGESAVVPVPVSGTVLFRDNLLYALADPDGVLNELDGANNVDHSGRDCASIPAPGDFSPVVELSWPLPETVDSFSADSLSTPLVVQLTDDDGNGRLDERDVPDLVFVTYDLSFPLNPAPRLRAIRGDTGATIWDAFPPISGLFQTFALTGAAAGDIDRDGRPEIVVSTFDTRGPTGRPNRIAAYEHHGGLKWVSPRYSTHPDGDSVTNRDNPSIADLDGDGTPEIVVGANVFSNTGSLLWTGSGGQGYQSARNDDGFDSGAISIVADLDLAGDPEVVTGNTAYRADGTIWWQIPMDDGYPAVGNFDGDDFPEIVVVSRGVVRLHEHDGTLIWSAELPGAGAEAGGAPTVANVDGDPAPEIGVAGSTQYTVFEPDGSVKWQAPTQDGSSNMTGSTVFDLDGDGRFEVIYRDETALRIYRGEDGTVLYELPLSSITLNEQPVVADVDRDGNAEIVVTSDLADGVSVPERTRGLRVLGDAGDRWIAARPVWNQHAYHVSNVAEDGHTVPAREEPSWLGHNTYRANGAPPAGAFAAPDLSASRIRVDLSAYPTALATVRIGNGGTLYAAAGLPVAFYDGDPADPSAGATLLGVATVDRDLEPGAFADVTLEIPTPAFGASELFTVADDDGTGAGGQTECDEANNVHGILYDTGVLGLLLDLEDGLDAVQPGETFTYTLTIANGGLAARTGVAVTHTLSAHVSVVSASDGGAEAGGVVTWPAFDLPGGATATRTLTLRVDPAIPLSVTHLTNTATVTDDGSGGPDPTPANNTDSDTNSLLTVSADAGGPYTGEEGTAVAFDGSGSSDRDGTVVAWEWDFDRDGVVDATGVTASHAFDDDGTYRVELRVTDDSGEQDVDVAEVTVSNLAPALDAGPDQTLVEGDAATLMAAVFTDPGAADTHTATVDWGDGTVASGVVDQAAGTVAAGHDYPDDGVFPVEVCVTDDDGATACDRLTVTVDNAPPVVIEPGDVDLSTWQAEHYTHTGHSGTPTWVVASDGRSVVQTRNAPAAFFFGDFPAFGTRVRGRIRVETSRDDDYIGFALGYNPGDVQNPDADFLLLDWKQRDQGAGREGLAVSRVTGLEPAIGSHEGETIEELARGNRFGSTGWQDYREYEFTIEFTPGRLRVFVDGVLEIDLTGAFSGGRLAFYNASQERVRYRAFSVESLVADEGSLLAVATAFGDLGVLDTHTATVDWDDGTVEPAAVDEESGFGTVTAEHVYADDAAPAVEVCVTDDDGGTGCGSFPAVINNLPPVVDAGGDRLAYTTEGLDVTAPFADGGLLDTHTATIDWGDGTVETVPAEATDGSGTLTGSHAYAAEGEYAVQVCVTDDDGGTGCDRFRVTWLVPVVDLAVSKRADARAVRPDQTLRYDLFVENQGTREPETVVVTDTLPETLDFVSAGSGGVYDPLAHTVTWQFPVLRYRERVHLELTARAQGTLPFDTPALNTVTVTDDGRFGADEDPADNGASATVRLWDGATPIVDARAPVNLSRTADVFADASSEGGLSVSVSRVIDGNPNTSWFTACGDAANQGGSPFAEVVLPRDATVHELRVLGNRQNANGRDIFTGRFQLFDAEGAELFDSHELALPAPVRDLALPIPSTAGVRRVRFTSTDDESCNPGLAEIEVIGFYGDSSGDGIPEGGTLDLDAAFFDSDPAEGHSATIDWGDGTTEAGLLDQSGADGTVDGRHVYPEDGAFVVQVCVTDAE
ncbi:MAG: PKD domain-containing protein, partial [Gemmatimonadota bacterium]